MILTCLIGWFTGGVEMEKWKLGIDQNIVLIGEVTRGIWSMWSQNTK